MKEIRNPNIEIRKKSKTRNPKARNEPAGEVLDFAFLKFEFVSNFDLRISEFDPSTCPGARQMTKAASSNPVR